MNLSAKDLWLKTVSTQVQNDWNLICFPFLCGFAEYFLSWQRLLPDSRLYAIQLPGHGSRKQETHITHIDNLLERLLPALLPTLEEKPYVLFGHSMGGYLAYRTARKLQELNFNAPLLLVVSGTSGPIRLGKQKRNTDVKTIKNVEIAFQKEEMISPVHLQYLNEMNMSVYWDKLLLKSCAVNVPAQLNYPVLLIAGSEDTYVLPEDVLEWKNETKRSLLYQVIDGSDHFSLKQDVLLNMIKQKVNHILSENVTV
jgi:surfactin synthase thioesterase subunit